MAFLMCSTHFSMIGSLHPCDAFHDVAHGCAIVARVHIDHLVLERLNVRSVNRHPGFLDDLERLRRLLRPQFPLVGVVLEILPLTRGKSELSVPHFAIETELFCHMVHLYHRSARADQAGRN